MLPSISTLAFVVISFLEVVTAQTFDPDLVGTWSTKSNKTFTGPGFYDPVNERFTEPERTGISYSFTIDGYYENAHYRAIPNPSNPECPKGIIQWQHGVYEKQLNGSLILEPFAVDGRQLYSDPCRAKNSIYTRYNQTELFERYEVFIDPYHNIYRLNLFRFDGSPMNPMYLVYRPPQMLPTMTLNPTAPATTAGPVPTAAAGAKVKRTAAAEELFTPMNQNVLSKKTTAINVDRWWWVGVTMTGVGGLLYFCF